MDFKNLFSKVLGKTSERSQEQHQEVIQLYETIFREALATSTGEWSNIKISESEAYQILRTKDDSFKVQFLEEVVSRITQRYKDRKKGGQEFYTYHSSDYQEDKVEQSLISSLLRSNIPLTEKQLIQITRQFRSTSNHSFHLPYKPLLSFIAKHVAEHGLSKAMNELLTELYFTSDEYTYAEDRNLNNRIEEIRSGQSKELVKTIDPFGLVLDAEVKSREGDEYDNWVSLIQLLKQAKQSSKPSKKWKTESDKLLSQLDVKILSEHLSKWFELASSLMQDVHKRNDNNVWFMHDENLIVLRSMVWLVPIINDEALNLATEGLGLMCYKKLPGHGGLSVKVGNACLYAFSELPYEMGVSRLSKFKQKVKLPSVRAQIQKLIGQVAEKEGKTIDQIEELAIPDFGLDQDNCFKESFGDYTALVRISRIDRVDLIWEKPDGKTQKSIPASIKDSHAEELKELKRKAKEIQNLVKSQKDRIEAFYLKERSWEFAEWSKYYHNHGLVSFVSKLLIWQFEENNRSAEAIFLDGRFLARNGEEISWITDSTTVKLWHPIGKNPEHVLSWRNLLLDREIQQPFKQAFREVYLVTDAELNTESYSNRFAAHILKQHQMAALCRNRNWAFSLMGAWDNMNNPTLYIEHWRIKVEFWIEGNWDDHANINDVGIFNYVLTDQVRFYDRDGRMNMQDVPVMAFSEAMRDIDLFVGVASIGNDPNWVDGGGEERYNSYWHDYSFGALSEAAKVRKQVLENLVPRLKIAKQCSFNGNYLIVQGSIKTYKIHMGSGNILMEPNDRYLCIVADQTANNRKIFLPFEGDRQLSIILSKAFLLAEDQKITDPEILRQIR